MPDFDVSVPHIARIYDYWLGGKDNFAADREAAERAMAATPTIVPGDIAIRAEESLSRSMSQKVTFRTHGQVSRFFAGLDLADPGVVRIQDWRTDSPLDLSSAPTAPASQNSYRTSGLTRPVPLPAVAPKPKSDNRLVAIRKLING